MKILLKKILEKLILVVFCFIIIFGNFLLVYNIGNKFIPIDEKLNIKEIIDTSKYISIRDLSNDKTILIDSYEKKEELKNIFDKIKIRQSKLNIIDKSKKIDYVVLFINSEGKEIFINIANKEAMICDAVYETDYRIDSFINDLF